MSERAFDRLTLDEFDSWHSKQEVRCELVDGRPMGMTGATFAHDRVAGNILLALRSQFRANGNPCDAFGPDIGVVIDAWTLRRPDVSVFCPPFDETATRSDRPRLVVEVLSRSTEQLDQVGKAEEYKRLPSLETILLVNPHVAEIGIWQRDAVGSWVWRRTNDITAAVALPGLGISLALAAVYDRAPLAPSLRPRLIWPGGAT